jgi:hypothetical protein
MPDTRHPYPSDHSEEEKSFEPLLVVSREPIRSSKWLPEGRTTDTKAGETEEALRSADEAEDHRQARPF